MSILESFDDDAFIPDDPENFVSSEDYARIRIQRNQFLRAAAIYAGDMDDGGRALMAVITRFGSQMQAGERLQLLDIHARLVYPEAEFTEDFAQVNEACDAEMLVDISLDDTGEVIAERVALAAIIDNRRERARIRAEIDRQGGATLGDGRRVSAVVAPNGILRRLG